MAAIGDYGWVSNPDDLVSWENGLKWLSKAIVSDNDQADKEELKQVLDLHLEASFSHAKPSIRGVAVFYALCWRKFPMLVSFWDRSDVREMRRLLNDGLSKMYSNYPTMELDFNLFLDRDRETCFRMVRLLVEQKLPDPLVLRRIQPGLFSGNSHAEAAALLLISELVLLLGMSAEAFRPLLEPFFNKGCHEFHEAVTREDWVWGLDFLQMIEPVRRIIIGYGFHDHLHRSFRGFFFCAPTPFFRETFVALIRWGFLDMLRDYIKQARDESIVPLLAEVSARYLEPGVRGAVGRYHSLYYSLFAAGWEVLYDFFEALEKVPGAGQFLCGHFRSGLLDSDPLKMYSADPEWLFTISANLQLVLRVLPAPPEALKEIRFRFLESIWKTVIPSRRPRIWRDALALMHTLCHKTGDPLIQSEFFLPLLKEGIFSASVVAARVCIRYAVQDRQLRKLLEEWAEGRFVQEDLLQGLAAHDLATRILACTRITRLYLRLDIRSSLLGKKLRDMRDQYLAKEPSVPYLPTGADRLLVRVIARVGV